MPTEQQIKEWIQESQESHRHDGNSAQQVLPNDLFGSTIKFRKGDNFGDAVVFSVIETIAAGGTSTALSLIKELHSVDADAGGDIFTLADGIIGQIMTITCLSATGVATITPANLSGGTSITLNAAGETVILQFVDTNWYIIGGNAYTVI